MRKPVISDDWPDTWKKYFQTDRAEWWGWRVNIGYTYAYQRRFIETMRLVDRYLPAGSEIIDVAGGKGNFSLALAEHGYRVVWNDLREDLQGYIELKWESGDIRFLPGNAFDIEHDYLYDAVLATEVIEHVAHPADFLVQLGSLVRPGGFVFLSTPHGGYFRTGLPTFSEVDDVEPLESRQFQPGVEGHLFLFTNDELRQLAATAGLDVMEITNFTSPVFSSSRGLVARGLCFVPPGAAQWVNVAVERTSKRLLLNTAMVLRRPQP